MTKMKKVILLILVCTMLAGCGTSVGIIGGSDGPTTIFVSEGENSQTMTGVKMIKVDGELYYDSGKVSDLIPRCGTMSDSLKMTAYEFEIPKNDNECNFEGASGYQSATGMTKEVPIDGEWVIFKKIADDERDFSKYTYCYKVRGKHPNAVNKSEYIVLANSLDITFDKVEKHLFSSNLSDQIDIYVIPILEEDEWGIELFAKDVTKSSLTLVCEQFGGEPSGALQSGSWYELEYYDNGQWKNVEYLPQDYDVAWTSAAYIIPKNNRVEWEVNWEWLYGKLDEGTYRISKEITDFRATGDFDEKIYYAQFYVEG